MFSRPSTVSLTSADRICSGTICDPWLMSAAAVAYDENAFANSSRVAPRNAGQSKGTAIRVQYCQVLAPRLTAASRHCGRRPSNAGRNTITMSGIWK